LKTNVVVSVKIKTTRLHSITVASILRRLTDALLQMFDFFFDYVLIS